MNKILYVMISLSVQVLLLFAGAFFAENQCNHNLFPPTTSE